MEDFFVIVADKFVFEDALALVSPESDEEELRADLFLDVVALLDDLILGFGGDLADTLEYSGQLTDVEHVVELGWRRQQSVLDDSPKRDCRVNQRSAHRNHLRCILLGVEQLLQDLTVDVLNRSS